MKTQYRMLAIPLCSMSNVEGGKAWFVLSASSSSVDLDSDQCKNHGAPLPIGWKGSLCSDHREHAPICIREQGGQLVVRLLETETYEWGLEDADGLLGMDNVFVKSALDEKRKQRWLVRKTKGRVTGGQFTVVNHLGFSSLAILGGDEEILLEIPLEFVSKKLDFDTEYRKMTEDIADFCEQLLLSWNAPTSLRFSADPSQPARLLLERFLFLRHFFTPARMGRLLEVIASNPHSMLKSEHEWKPASMARSSDFLSHPGKMLRSWSRQGGRSVPSEILDVRKEDTHDTPPNRFVKFALAQFRQLCSDVIAHQGDDSTIGAEAGELIRLIDAITARPFFRSISRLNRLPLDNQTLQKGEGYREILRAWLLTDAAASLNWQGQKDSYDGSTRDVATLYEYWIFLQLHQILDSFPNMDRLSGASSTHDNIAPFIEENNGTILINLKSGKQSLAQFLLRQPHQADLRIDLHYEKTFGQKNSAHSSGSYSRQFRPDYTLSIFPAEYETSSEAEKAGKVSHLHFDAKYRATQLSQVFGDNDEDIVEEKENAKSLSIYQRGDLLKMHTYNDALRHTIGSYVLYPGRAEKKTEYRKFHEIAPGVGALIMKPGMEECLQTLKAFLSDIFTHQSSQFTQYRYTSDTHHQIIEKGYGTLSEGEATYYIARPNAPCVMIWLRKADADIFRKHGFAYCHAFAQSDRKLDLDLSIEIGSELIPCGGAQGEKITGLGWRAKITSARFMAKEKLEKFIADKGLSSKLSLGSATHYLVFEFKEASEIKPLDLDDLHKKYSKQAGSKYMAVTCLWQEILDQQSGRKI